MKALSIHPYEAMAIVEGDKTIECRTWATEYRGDIVICSTNKKYHGTIPGHALGVVTLKDIVPFTKQHCKAALMRPADFRPGMYAWMLTHNRLIVPQPVKGKLSLWEYTGSIEYVPPELWAVPDGMNIDDIPEGDWFEKNWNPIMV